MREVDTVVGDVFGVTNGCGAEVDDPRVVAGCSYPVDGCQAFGFPTCEPGPAAWGGLQIDAVCAAQLVAAVVLGDQALPEFAPDQAPSMWTSLLSE